MSTRSERREDDLSIFQFLNRLKCFFCLTVKKIISPSHLKFSFSLFFLFSFRFFSFLFFS